jgi:hypothetical protein
MQKRKPLNNSVIHVVMLSQQQSVVSYTTPMRRAVNTAPIETKSISRESDEVIGNQGLHVQSDSCVDLESFTRTECFFDWHLCLSKVTELLGHGGIIPRQLLNRHILGLVISEP